MDLSEHDEASFLHNTSTHLETIFEDVEQTAHKVPEFQVEHPSLLLNP